MRWQDFLQRQEEFRLEFHQEQRSGQRSRWQRELKMQGRIWLQFCRTVERDIFSVEFIRMKRRDRRREDFSCG